MVDETGVGEAKTDERGVTFITKDFEHEWTLHERTKKTPAHGSGHPVLRHRNSRLSFTTRERGGSGKSTSVTRNTWADR